MSISCRRRRRCATTNHTRQQRPLLYLTYGKPWLPREMIENANFTDAKLTTRVKKG